MVEENDLRGLTLNGFENEYKRFDNEIFKENETILHLRKLISKYLTKTEKPNMKINSYGMKHTVERIIDRYVSNGELIYAMHLEGFKIKRYGINCCFNLKAEDYKLLNDKDNIIQLLAEHIDPQVFTNQLYNKEYDKFKYHFNLIIRKKFRSKVTVNNQVVKLIAKEMNEANYNILYWFEILKGQDATIPLEKMKQLEKLFNMSQNSLTNFADKH